MAGVGALVGDGARRLPLAAFAGLAGDSAFSVVDSSSKAGVSAVNLRLPRVAFGAAAFIGLAA